MADGLKVLEGGQMGKVWIPDTTYYYMPIKPMSCMFPSAYPLADGDHLAVAEEGGAGEGVTVGGSAQDWSVVWHCRYLQLQQCYNYMSSNVYVSYPAL